MLRVNLFLFPLGGGHGNLAAGPSSMSSHPQLGNDSYFPCHAPDWQALRGPLSAWNRLLKCQQELGKKDSCVGCCQALSFVIKCAWKIASSHLSSPDVESCQLHPYLSLMKPWQKVLIPVGHVKPGENLISSTNNPTFVPAPWDDFYVGISTIVHQQLFTTVHHTAARTF